MEEGHHSEEDKKNLGHRRLWKENKHINLLFPLLVLATFVKKKKKKTLIPITLTKAGNGRAEDVRIFIGGDQNGEDRKGKLRFGDKFKDKAKMVWTCEKKGYMDAKENGKKVECSGHAEDRRDRDRDKGSLW